MKSLYHKMLATALVFVAALGLHAQKVYWDVETDYVTTIEPGVNYVLENGYSDATEYVCGAKIASAANDDCIYQFEVVGTTSDGSTTYMLKQVSTGLYLESPENTSDQTTVSYTSAKSRAFVFTAKQSVASDDYSDEFLATADLTTYTYADVDEGYPVREGSFVFCRTDWSTEKLNWFCCYTAPMWYPQYDTCNVFYVYKVKATSAYNSLCMAYEDYFSDGATPADLFIVGENPGQISQSVFDALQTAYDNAKTLIDNTEAADEAYQSAQLAMEEAYAAAEAAIKPVTAGYYFIRSGLSSYCNGYGSMYDSGSGLYMYEYQYDATAEPSLSDAYYIWQAVDANDGDGGFYLQNYYTGKYIGTQASGNAIIYTTDAPEQVYYIKSRTGDTFSIYTKGVNDVYNSFYASTWNAAVINWADAYDENGWRFEAVSESLVQSLTDLVAQKNLNEKAQELVYEAQLAISSGIAVSSAATADALYDVTGDVTDATCYFSNAKETSEGSYEGLLDNDQKTYFHSAWSTTDHAYETHYIAADLGEATQYMQIKYSRRNTGKAGTPKTIQIYAVNDTTGLSTGECEWVEQGRIELSYPYAANDTYSPPGTAEFTGLASIALDAPYKYVRLDVVHTLNDATTYGNLYFVFSELHFYKGAYDANNSLIEAVPADITATLKQQIASMQAALNAGDITQEAYDALQTAYDQFMEKFPQIAAAKELLSDAQALLASAEEGSDLGYFAEGSKATFEDALKAAEGQVKGVMTVDEVTALENAINAAVDNFNKALNKPADGAIIRIKSASSTTSINGSYVYAADNDESHVCYGSNAATASSDEHLADRLTYYWRVIDNGDGTYAYRNVATGTYLGTRNVANYYVNMSLTPKASSLQSARVPGYFNIVFADGIYASAYASGKNIISSATASGTDNSAFEIETISEDMWAGEYYLELSNAPQIVTLPLEITGMCTNGAIYKVLGTKENAVELTSFKDDEVIPAGTPFIYIPAEDAETGAVSLFPTATQIADITTVSEALSLNGLQGTLQSAAPGEGNGIIYNGAIAIATADDVVAANTGWFTDSMPVADHAGDARLTIDGTITGIGQTVLTPAAGADVYTISGVKVRSAVNAANAVKNLPAGLYIVGGKKVLVK